MFSDKSNTISNVKVFGIPSKLCGHETKLMHLYQSNKPCSEIAKLLKPLLKYSINDFDKTDGNVKDGTFAHVMKRFFGAFVLAQGYTIHGIKHDNYQKGFILASIKHFLFQKKQIQHRFLIKICRIPVYSRKWICND